MSYKIDEVEGIGPAYSAKLAKVDITTTGALLKKGANKKGRQAIANETGISEKLVLTWCNLADLMRISGIGPQFSELLEAAGVDTVKELRNRKAENLAEKMQEINDSKKLTRQVPPASKVTEWVEQAKKLAPVLQY